MLTVAVVVRESKNLLVKRMILKLGSVSMYVLTCSDKEFHSGISSWIERKSLGNRPPKLTIQEGVHDTFHLLALQG